MTDAGRTRLQQLWSALAAPRDIASIAAFRVAFGAIVVISSLRFLSYGWIDELYSKPGFHMRYWGFSWVPLPSPAVTTALFVATGVLGLLVALGLCYRPAVALLFVAFTYLQLVDVATYLNHYYLVSLFAALLVFIPAHRAASLDARLRPAIRAATLPAWCTYLLRFQVAVVYVNAGLAKATADWLLHAQPLNLWLSARTGLPVVGPYLDLPGVAHVAAWAGFLFDTTIVLFLLWRRTRAVAYLAVLAFHAGDALPVPAHRHVPRHHGRRRDVFFDASWPRRCCAGATAPAGRRAPPARQASRAVRVAAAAAGLYMRRADPAAAALAPLRRQRALARAGDAVLVAGDGAREERQRDVHRPRPARRQAVARVAGEVPDPHPGARDGGAAGPDPAARPPHRARVRGGRAARASRSVPTRAPR